MELKVEPVFGVVGQRNSDHVDRDGAKALRHD